MQARIHCIPAAGPDEVTGNVALANGGAVGADCVVQGNAKTTGDGQVDDIISRCVSASHMVARVRLTGSKITDTDSPLLVDVAGASKTVSIVAAWLRSSSAESALGCSMANVRYSLRETRRFVRNG